MELFASSRAGRDTELAKPPKHSPVFRRGAGDTFFLLSSRCATLCVLLLQGIQLRELSCLSNVVFPLVTNTWLSVRGAVCIWYGSWHCRICWTRKFVQVLEETCHGLPQSITLGKADCSRLDGKAFSAISFISLFLFSQLSNFFYCTCRYELPSLRLSLPNDSENAGLRTWSVDW